MRNSEAILVLLDEDASDDDEDFMWSYFGRLAETWIQSEDVDVQRVSSAEAVTLLQQTPNAVYVSPAAPRPSTPTPTRPATGTATPVGTASSSTAQNLGSSPFYIDGDGTAWRIWFEADSAAVVAFGRFTRAILSTGDYFDMYVPLFEVTPPYEELLRLGP
jgi:hypothetical protein